MECLSIILIVVFGSITTQPPMLATVRASGPERGWCGEKLSGPRIGLRVEMRQPVRFVLILVCKVQDYLEQLTMIDRVL
jgi:hypothetical protein